MAILTWMAGNWKSVLIAAVVAALLGFAYSFGYVDGQAEREGFYGPKIAVVEAEKAALNLKLVEKQSVLDMYAAQAEFSKAQQRENVTKLAELSTSLNRKLDKLNKLPVTNCKEAVGSLQEMIHD